MISRRLFLSTLALPILGTIASAAQPPPAATAGVTVVACVGDSITAFGNPKGYPAQLAKMLGSDWEVKNFGVSGSTLMNKANKPYQKQERCAEALASAPNVVVIMLGTNDTKPKNWKLKDGFVADYRDLVGKFKALPTKPKILLVKSPYITPKATEFSDTSIVEQQAMIDEVAKVEGCATADAHAATQGKDGLFPDGVHPHPNGATEIAKVVYQALTGRPYVTKP